MSATSHEQAVCWGGLGVYAAAHCAVDATCLAILWVAYESAAISGSAAWSVFFAYNLLAFAPQPLVGMAVDRGLSPRWTTVAGGAAVAVAAAVAPVPGGIYAALVVMGLGNAVFHVGGGVVALRLRPGRAGPVGLFVAPGAAGVLVGTLAGKDGGPMWPIALALACLLALVACLPAPDRSRRRALSHSSPYGAGHAFADAGTQPRSAAPPALASLGWTVLLLLFVVAVRSYVGVALALPWKSDQGLLVALTAGVVAGKAAGGLLGDRFGWAAVGVGALLVSIPLMLLGEGSAALGIAGVLIFNMTMPITVAALARALPGRPGLAFGATCLALFAGCAVPLAGAAAPAPVPAIVTLGCLAAVALLAALRLLARMLSPSRSGAPSAPGAPTDTGTRTSRALVFRAVDEPPPPVQ